MWNEGGESRASKRRKKQQEKKGRRRQQQQQQQQVASSVDEEPGVASAEGKGTPSISRNSSRKCSSTIVSVPGSFEPGADPHLLCTGLEGPGDDSTLRARRLLEWLVAPLKRDEFYRDYWEKQAVLLRRNSRFPNYNDGWIHPDEIFAALETHSMKWGHDIDVTSYDGKKRITLNKQAGERAKHSFVRECFGKGCSVRLTCPQKYFDPIHRLLAALEEEWGCMVGSNVYLTPSGYRGFAPHWDDVEAFLVQVEGTKRWRVYAPLEDSQELPRASSEDFSPEQLEGISPFIDADLQPGDVLYLPRGWIHQGESVGKSPSLHLTVSSFQQNAWVDILEVLIPEALAAATSAHLPLREGLPRDYLKYMGVCACQDEEGEQEKGGGEVAAEDIVLLKKRKVFKESIRARLSLVCNEALSMLDAASDQMGKKYLSDRLPPVLAPVEESKTVSNVESNGSGVCESSLAPTLAACWIWPAAKIHKPNVKAAPTSM